MTMAMTMMKTTRKTMKSKFRSFHKLRRIPANPQKKKMLPEGVNCLLRLPFSGASSLESVESY